MSSGENLKGDHISSNKSPLVYLFPCIVNPRHLNKSDPALCILNSRPDPAFKSKKKTLAYNQGRLLFEEIRYLSLLLVAIAGWLWESHTRVKGSQKCLLVYTLHSDVEPVTRDVPRVAKILDICAVTCKSVNVYTHS